MRRISGHAVLVVLIAFLTVMPSRLMAQESVTESGESRRIVNVELIVDSSGSMAGVTDTGDIRVDAAKAVLTEVVNAIPETEGINVGLRVYGHRGDNTDTTRALSCDASDLVVPVKGVDKAALEAKVMAIQPTGWTPIGESLKRAAEDFPQGDSEAINAIVVLTDGIETCDGDPVGVAKQLHDSPAAITTHVIGFATTPEDQTTLSEIASAGGGKLFGAANASELSSALFEILEQLDVVVGAGYVGGNAFSLLPLGESGQVSVVSFSAGSGFGNFPVVVRNNTGQDVSEVKVNVTIRDGAGSLIAAGDVQPHMSPRYVRAGGLAIGHFYLGQDVVIPDNAKVDFDVSFSPAVRLKPYAWLDYDVTEAALFDNRIVGMLKNNQPATGENGVHVEAICFDLDGNPLSADQGNVNTMSVASGEELSYQVDIIGSFAGQQCPAFLVAGGSYSTGNIQAKNLAPNTAATKPSSPSAPQTPGSSIAATPAGSGVETPVSTTIFPTQDPTLSVYGTLGGIKDAAARGYVSPSDPNIWLSFAVAEFETAEQAKAAVPILVDRDRTRQLQVLGTTVVDEGFSVDGVESGHSFLFQRSLGTVSQYVSETVFQIDNRVYLAGSSSYTPEFDPASVNAVLAMLVNPDRDGSGQGVITERLWKWLPYPSDIPVGFVLSSDYVPVSFGPIPPK